MFKSKKFLIGFIALCVLNVALIVFFIYLLSADGTNKLTSAASGTTAAPTETSGESVSESGETEESTVPTSTQAPSNAVGGSVRALKITDAHEYPIIDEDIPASGTLTIIKSGDNGEGIVFHANPIFDAEETEGNIVQYSGSFQIVAKIYIMEKSKPYLMYKTAEGYYVTSNTTYVQFDPVATRVIPDYTRVGTYGHEEDQGVVAIVYSDDGNHVAFSLYNNNDGSLSPVLTNCIAAYDDTGIAHFEYHNADDSNYQGTLSFKDVEGDGYTRQIVIELDSPVVFKNGASEELILHN